MAPSDDYSKAFWLSFGKLIKDQVAPGLGQKSAIFFNAKSQLGPPASESNEIHPAYTNFGIHTIANNQLIPGSLTYVPSEASSYIRSLLTYLEDVDLAVGADKAAVANLEQCKRNLAQADQAFQAEKSRAEKSWSLDIELGMVQEGTSISEWAMMRAPRYSMAESARAAAASKYDEAVIRVSGPKSAQYMQDVNRIRDAINKQSPLSGLTMEITNATPSSAADIDAAVQLQQRLSTPPISYAPAYSAPGYAAAVKAWVSKVGSYTTRSEKEITFDQGRTVDQAMFGQTSGSATLDAPTPWFSFSMDGNQESSVFGSEDLSRILIKASWEDMRGVPVSPGSWDLKDLRNYSLKKDTKIKVKQVVRPTQMVLVSKLQFNIQLDASTREVVDKRIKELAAGRNGFLRVFGLDVSVGGTTGTKTSHQAEWDAASGALVVKPTAAGFQVNVCGLVGDKLDMP